MLCQFSFKNFKSYKDETVFDMQAANLPEFAENIIYCKPASNLLPVAAIYGPNGGGKTNMLQALTCLISTVVKPIYDMEKTRTKLIVQQKVSCTPFLFDEKTSNEPTEFLLYFRTNGYEYRYYLSMLHDEIIAEALDRKKIGGKRTAHVFDREEKVITLGSSINKASINRDVNPKMPYLSFLAINYDIPAINDAQKWFENCIIRSYANPEAELQIMLSDNKTIRRQIISALNDMGIDINGYRYDNDSKQLIMQRTLHGKTYELSYKDESDGTKKLIAALPILLIALAEGRLAVIDELDAKLHPKLLRYIMALFKNPKLNTHGAQLIFTSHDIATMKNTVYRRDEIWFAAEGDNHSSELYSLYEIRKENNERINNTAAYDKQYLEGRYGADPYLQNMLKDGEWQ